MTEERPRSKCGRVLSLDRFPRYTIPSGETRYKRTCKDCRQLQGDLWRLANKDRINARRRELYQVWYAERGDHKRDYERERGRQNADKRAAARYEALIAKIPAGHDAVKALALRHFVSAACIDQLARNGKVAAIRIGRRWYVSEASLKNYIDGSLR